MFREGIEVSLARWFKRPFNANWRLKICRLDPLFKFQGITQDKPELGAARPFAVDIAGMQSRFSR